MRLSCNRELKETVSQFTVAKTSSFAIVRPAVLRSRPVTVNGGVSRRGGTEYAVSARRAQVIPRQGWHSGRSVKMQNYTRAKVYWAVSLGIASTPVSSQSIRDHRRTSGGYRLA